MARHWDYESLESREMLTATLVSDIETRPVAPLHSNAVEIAGNQIFAFQTVELGTELWRTDGTPEGTELVEEAVLGPANSGDSKLYAVGGRVIQFVSDDPDRFSILTSDGQSVQQHESFTETLGQTVPFDGGVVFHVFDRHFESRLLWTDGNRTEQIGEVGFVHGLSVVNGQLLIPAGDALYKYANGELEIIDDALQLWPPTAHTRNDQLFLFEFEESVGHQLTVRTAPDFEAQVLQDISGFPQAFPADENAGEFYFVSHEVNTSTIWSSDGSFDGTREFITVEGQVVTQVHPVGEQVYVGTSATDGSRFSISLLEDGSFRRLKTFDGHGTMSSLGDLTLLTVRDGDSTLTYQVDGESVKSLDISPSATVLTKFDDQLLVVEPGELPYTHDLATYDLATEQRAILRTFNTPSESSLPANLLEINGHLSFSTQDGVYSYDGNELAKIHDSDIKFSVPLGDKMVYGGLGAGIGGETHFWIGDGSSTPLRRFTRIDSPFIESNDVFTGGNSLFIHFDSRNEIWVSEDGSEPRLLSDIAPQMRESTSAAVEGYFSFTEFDDALYVRALLDDGSTQVWRTNGTTAGTRLLAVDEPPVYAMGSDRYYVLDTPEDFPSDSNYQVFHSTEDDGALELLTELDSNPRVLDTSLGFFFIDRDRDRSVLRNSNLEVLAELQEAEHSLGLHDTETVGNEFYFSTTETKREISFTGATLNLHTRSYLSIWKSDGTAAGTSRIIRHEVGDHESGNLTTLNGMVFYEARNTDGQSELWATDGTSENTYVYELIGERKPLELTRFGDRVFFAAESSQFGRELWQVVDPRPLRGDIDGNNQVDFADFLLLTSEFAQQGTELASDIDDDGTVGFSDFLALSQDFGITKADTPESPLETIQPRRVDLAMQEIDFSA